MITFYRIEIKGITHDWLPDEPRRIWDNELTPTKIMINAIKAGRKADWIRIVPVWICENCGMDTDTIVEQEGCKVCPDCKTLREAELDRFDGGCYEK